MRFLKRYGLPKIHKLAAPLRRAEKINDTESRQQENSKILDASFLFADKEKPFSHYDSDKIKMAIRKITYR